MPIKEIIAISGMVLSLLFAAHPKHFEQAVLELKLAILRDVGRTDNWGNPSIFRPSRHSSGN